jgi:hypothetical protein
MKTDEMLLLEKEAEDTARSEWTAKRSKAEFKQLISALVWWGILIGGGLFLASMIHSCKS